MTAAMKQMSRYLSLGAAGGGHNPVETEVWPPRPRRLLDVALRCFIGAAAPPRRRGMASSNVAANSYTLS